MGEWRFLKRKLLQVCREHGKGALAGEEGGMLPPAGFLGLEQALPKQDCRLFVFPFPPPKLFFRGVPVPTLTGTQVQAWSGTRGLLRRREKHPTLIALFLHSRAASPWRRRAFSAAPLVCSLSLCWEHRVFLASLPFCAADRDVDAI